MEKASTFGGAARRAQLIDCAIEALCEEGFAGASVAEVARRAGVSKGVVSYHFASKADLLQQVVTALYERAGGSIQMQTAAQPSVGDTLRTYIEANLGFVAQHPRHVRAVMEIVANAKTPERAGEDPLAAYLTGVIEDGVARGEFTEVDAPALAMVIRAAIDAAAGKVAMLPEFDMAAYSSALVGFVAAALGVRS